MCSCEAERWLYKEIQLEYRKFTEKTNKNTQFSSAKFFTNLFRQNDAETMGIRHKMTFLAVIIKKSS